MTDNTYNNQGYSEENVNNAVRKKRHRRPNLNEEDPKPTVEVNEEVAPVKEHRRRRRREPKNPEESTPNGPIGVAAYLEDLQDDIEMKVNTDIPTIEALTISKGKSIASQGAGDKVYIEGTRNFRVENHEKYLRDRQKLSEKQAEKLNINQGQYDNDLLQCSIGVTDRFRIFATFLHGLFAGMCLMHMIFSLVTGGNSSTAFLTSYAPLQQPLSIFNYVAFIIISISLWDRLDLGEPTPHCSQSQAGTIVALILTLAAFVISNSLYLYNQDFNYYNTNQSNAYLAALITSYATWRVLDAVKSILLVIGWFIVALIPIYDRFIENLKQNIDQDLSGSY